MQRPPAPPRILVVEDVPDIATVLVMLLGGSGFETLTAADGAEALAKADPCPDLVLLDLIIPPPDGFEVARTLRARHPDLPILAVTVVTDAAERSRALECGVNEIVTKPFDPDDLLARVRSWLGRGAGPRRSRRSSRRADCIA